MKTLLFRIVLVPGILMTFFTVSCHQNKANETSGDTHVTPGEKKVADTLSPNDEGQYMDNMDTVTE